MIHYSLRCAHGHAFDGWFASSAAFDRQRAGGALACPICGTSEVTRALMAPAVRAGPRAAEPAAEALTEHAAPTDADAARSPPAETRAPASALYASLDDGERRALVDAMRALRKVVKERGTDVGTDFAEEARRIHYGEAEPRGIYGKADPEEAHALREEGIGILPLPILPEDRN